jgi:maleamate amidohydrolase
MPPFDPTRSSRITDEDLAAYQAAGFANKSGFGDRPAVIVIDVQNRTIGPRKPVVEAIEESGYGPACGERAWAAIDNIAPLVHTARANDVPVLFAIVAPKRRGNAGSFERINPGITSVDEAGYGFPDEVAPQEGEAILPKNGPSAFFGTPLAATLNAQRIDTLILLGCTTSGCVRATSVDGFSLNYHVIVAHDGVYDRAAVSHEVSLFELDSKYADVVSSSDITAYLSGLKDGSAAS